jgi:hypothetical protein
MEGLDKKQIWGKLDLSFYSELSMGFERIKPRWKVPCQNLKD